MKRRAKNIVYSINISDLQDVAVRVLDRQLSEQEIESVAASLGDSIDWFQHIANAIDLNVQSLEDRRLA